MKRFIYFFMIFALSLATDVSVYKSFDDYYAGTGPVLKSVLPWKFGFTSRDRLYMSISYWNQPLSVTAANVTTEPDLVTVTNRKILTLSNGEIFYVRTLQLSSPEVIININLCTSNGLCRSIRVAEGRVVSRKFEKEYKYTDICFKEIAKPCVLVLDLKDVICIVPVDQTSSHENLETTTIKTKGNETNVKPTNNTAIIIGSLTGITLILIEIIALYKRCWMKHSPQGTPDLPTNHHSEPFYLNMLFRRECDQEIAEIDQHVYEEIAPQGTEGG